jgi:hypothetical protein
MSLRQAPPPSSFPPQSHPRPSASLARTYEPIGILQHVPSLVRSFIPLPRDARAMFQPHPCSWPSLNGRDPCSGPPISTRQSRGLLRLQYLPNSLGPSLLPRYLSRSACSKSASPFGVDVSLRSSKIIEAFVQPETAPRHIPATFTRYPKESDKGTRIGIIKERMIERTTVSGRGPPRANWPISHCWPFPARGHPAG